MCGLMHDAKNIYASLNIYLFDKLYNTIQYNTIQVHTKSLQPGTRKEACKTYPINFPVCKLLKVSGNIYKIYVMPSKQQYMYFLKY